MKILTVIHGYPPYYMAGSEVYTYNLCNELAKNHEVEIFTRYENPFEPQYTILENRVEGLKVTRVNKSSRDYTFQDKYIDKNIDKIFEEKLLSFKPDVVYIGHLSHLSTSFPLIAKKHNIKVAFTIHDFWMFCYRGQLITSWDEQCKGFSQENCFKCAQYTFKNWITQQDIKEYRQHMDKVLDAIDIFFAPSKTVYDFYIKNGINENKIRYSKYGFDTNKINYLKKIYSKTSKLNFGFMGRVIPVKGMKTLFEAFKKVPEAQLTIYGSQQYKKYLDLYKVKNLSYYGQYHNNDINKVLEKIDVLIVPSIWLENSPLVIQEAHLAGTPMITSNFGGMKELVEDNKDGFLFPVGDSNALANIVKKLIKDPTILNKVRGNPKKVRAISDDAKYIINEIEKLNIIPLGKLDYRPFPWRITFDTNPGICNLHCIMCEVHSLYNKNKYVIKELPVMNFEIIEKIVKEGAKKGLKEIIPSTMGEPLLYKEFDKIVELCKETGVKMNLTTNGTYPGKTIEEWAEILVPICSDIKISQNQSPNFNNTDKEIMIGITPQKSYEAIKIFVEKRNQLRELNKHAATITVQVTFMKRNLNHIADMIKIYGHIFGLGVDRIKGHHLWITWNELKEESMRANKENIKKWNEIVNKYQELSKIHKVKLQNFDKMLSDDDIVTPNSLCPFLGKEAWIAADGSFNVCCAPDKLRQTFGKFGNVNETDFIKLWQSESYKNFVKNWGNYEHCLKCNMRVTNREVVK